MLVRAALRSSAEGGLAQLRHAAFWQNLAGVDIEVGLEALREQRVHRIPWGCSSGEQSHGIAVAAARKRAALCTAAGGH
eukprot:3598877-Pyramimonas_sp.AAC.1